MEFYNILLCISTKKEPIGQKTYRLKTDKKLVIVGGTSDTDEYVRRLYDMAGDSPSILFTGFQQGPVAEELFSNAYLYVLPSDLEGMPLST